MGRRLRYVPVVADAADRPRLLHRRSEHGYTHVVHEALPGEPEAVSAAEQAAMSRRAREAQRARARQEWERADAQIHDAVNGFRQRAGHVPRGAESGVRAVLRASEQVGRRLQA
jgi:hypothetical protein